MTCTPLREALWLVQAGVPFDIAFSLDAVERAGWSIIVSEQQGREFSFATMSFKEIT